MTITFGSVCSGIEAASTAWHPLGWKTAYVADIEPFPCAVMAARIGAGRPQNMPDPEEAGIDDDTRDARRAAIKALKSVEWGDAVPNFGDFTKVDASVYPIDLLVGGTPCQAFSVAGERKSLADERGNLSLEFVRLVHATKSIRWVVWENVPGVLSTADNAFGCFLGGLIGADVPVTVPGGKWPSAGMVSGPLGRGAWRILDAQHFGLAQRRRRVFVVFCPRGSGGDPSAILFELQGVRWNFTEGGEAREGIAGGAGEGAFADVAATLLGGDGGISHKDCPEGRVVDCTRDGICGTVSAKWAKGSGGPAGDEHYNMVVDVAPTLLGGGNRTGGTRPPGSTVDNADGLIPVEVAHTLRADGFDASEDGTGRGTPLVPVASALTARMGQNGGANADRQAMIPVAFSAKDSGDDATEDLSPTLQSGTHNKSHANGGVMPAVAIPILEAGARTGTSTSDPRAGIGVGDNGDPMFTLQASKQHAVGASSAVRRLTPRECERLQGFPDDHTLIKWKGKPAPDGPRYKALGNSMAVPVMRWIGERIQAFEDGTLDDWIFVPSTPDYGAKGALMAELREEDIEFDASDDA